jgi:hypothetical protein
MNRNVAFAHSSVNYYRKWALAKAQLAKRDVYFLTAKQNDLTTNLNFLRKMKSSMIP